MALQNNYLHIENKNLFLIDSIYLVFPSLKNQRKLLQTKVWYKFFTLSDNNDRQTFKSINCKKFFSSVYVVGTTCLDKYVYIPCNITGRYRCSLLLSYSFFQPPCFCFLWKKWFERSPYFKYWFYYTAYSQRFKNFYGFANIPLHISLEMGNEVKKSFEFRVFKWFLFETQKNILMFLGQSLFFNFLQMIMFTTLFRRCSTFRESTLKRTTFLRRCSNQRRNRQRWRWFDVFQCYKFLRWCTQCCFNVNLTLCNVAVSYHPMNNLETTLMCLLGFDTTYVDFQ